MTKTLPAMMRTLRRRESQVRDLLKTTLSMKILNTGEVKLTTIKSPIGM